MTRDEYQRARHSARSASREYWDVLSDKYANTHDKDRARERMHRCIYAVPGGVWTPYDYPVQLDGWRSRRRNLRAFIDARKTRARIAECIEMMAEVL